MVRKADLAFLKGLWHYYYPVNALAAFGKSGISKWREVHKSVKHKETMRRGITVPVGSKRVRIRDRDEINRALAHLQSGKHFADKSELDRVTKVVLQPPLPSFTSNVLSGLQFAGA